MLIEGIAKTTERNGKIAIWITPPKEDNLFMPGDWNVGDISKKMDITEILKVVERAYKLGRKHQLNRISNYIDSL